MKSLFILLLVLILGSTPDIMCQNNINTKFAKLVKLNKKSKYWSNNKINSVAGEILWAEYLTNISADYYLAIIQRESEFNPYAFNKNSNGSSDCGLAQINTINYECSFDPVESIRRMANILENCKKRFIGLNIIRCYNWHGENYAIDIYNKAFLVGNL